MLIVPNLRVNGHQDSRHFIACLFRVLAGSASISSANSSNGLVAYKQRVLAEMASLPATAGNMVSGLSSYLDRLA